MGDSLYGVKKDEREDFGEFGKHPNDVDDGHIDMSAMMPVSLASTFSKL